MAQQTTITIIDDLDDMGLADETGRFALDGAAHQIDLTKTNAAILRSTLAPYVGVARKFGRVSTSKGGRKMAAEVRPPKGSEREPDRSR